jgi:hypothetical protein
LQSAVARHDSPRPLNLDESCEDLSELQAAKSTPIANIDAIVRIARVFMFPPSAEPPARRADSGQESEHLKMGWARLASELRARFALLDSRLLSALS